MLPESVKIVLSLALIQAFLALVIMVILRKFYIQYKNNYFQYWSWSWLALSVNMVGSAVALANAFLLPLSHPFRIGISVVTVCASFLQILWLFTGSFELSKERKLGKKTTWVTALAILPVSIILVSFYFNDPDGGNIRILFRVGVKSLIGGIIFIFSSILLFNRSRTGIGVKFIIFSFLIYGLLQFNTFLNDFSAIFESRYNLAFPFYLQGGIDLFLQALMGLGMIISVLEIEQDNLKKANKELDTFLYRSSHDLRAPLTTISGIVQVLRSETDPKKNENYLNLIDDRIIQADDVIRDIITLRKGQKESLNIRKIDLSLEIQKEFDLLKSMNNKNPEFQFEQKGNQQIHSDSERLHTVLTNILSNSIKYHNYDQKQPWIRVSSIQVDGGIKLRVSDNGLGIEEKHLSRIFEMFYRANKSSTGSGLGLYLVKDALDVMKGTIEISSQPGIGTDFTIFLKDLKNNFTHSETN